MSEMIVVRVQTGENVHEVRGQR